MEDSQLQEANEKVKRDIWSIGEEMASQIYTLIRILKHRAQGDLPFSIPWKVSLLVPIALGYFLFPFDLIPDVIPFFGYIGM